MVSSWAANNVFVSKKNHGMRVATDFRALNHVTETDSHSMEDVLNVLNWILFEKVYSMIDLKDGFTQVELDAESRPLTAVPILLGLLQYTRLPKQLMNSPGTFQQSIDLILGARKKMKCFLK